jgi:phage terminase small subunit
MTPKQQRFCQEYLVDLNATQAAIRAGYSPKTADVIANQNLGKLYIQTAIQTALADRAKRLEITTDDVLRELAKIGFSDMRKFTCWGPSGVQLKDSEALDKDDAACVAEVSQTVTENGGSIKFKLHDKVSALEKMGKHLGMFVDRIEHSGPQGGKIEVDLGIDELLKLDAKELAALHSQALSQFDTPQSESGAPTSGDSPLE